MALSQTTQAHSADSGQQYHARLDAGNPVDIKKCNRTLVSVNHIKPLDHRPAQPGANTHPRLNRSHQQYPSIDPIVLNPVSKFLSKALCHPLSHSCQQSLKQKAVLPSLFIGNYQGALSASSFSALESFLMQLFEKLANQIEFFQIRPGHQKLIPDDMRQLLRNVSISLAAALVVSSLRNTLHHQATTRATISTALPIFVGNLLAKTTLDYVKKAYPGDHKAKVSAALMVAAVRAILNSMPKLSAAHLELKSLNEQHGSEHHLNTSAYLAVFALVGIFSHSVYELMKHGINTY